MGEWRQAPDGKTRWWDGRAWGAELKEDAPAEEARQPEPEPVEVDQAAPAARKPKSKLGIYLQAAVHAFGLVKLIAAVVLIVLVAWVAVSCVSRGARTTPGASSSASAESSLPAGIWSESTGQSGVFSGVAVYTDQNLITIQAKGPTPVSGTIVYSVRAGQYLLGLKVVDGEATRYVFDFTDGSQKNFESSYMFSDSTVAFRFPKTAVPALAVGTQWQGTLTLDGESVDQTPWIVLQ